MSKIAFDVGSTVTRVLVDGEVMLQQPTCLALERDSGVVLAYGDQAYALLGKTARQVELQFPISRGVVADTTGLTLFLSELLKELEPRLTKNFKEIIFGLQVAVAYNPCSTRAQLSRLEAVFRTLGLKAKLVASPVAAALSFAKKSSVQKSICLIAVGGSLATCSIVTNGTHVQSYPIFWGGISLTEDIQRDLAKNEQLAIGWHEAERLKRALAAVFSSQTLAKYKDHKGVVRGQDLTTHVGKTLVISREQLARVTQPQVAEFISGVIDFLALLPREMVTNILENGIVLVGGGSLLPGISEALQEKIACKVTVAEQPDLACIRGLA